MNRSLCILVLLVTIHVNANSDFGTILSEIESLQFSLQSLRHDFEDLNEMANFVEFGSDVMKVNESQAAFHSYVRDTTITTVGDGSAIPYFENSLNEGLCTCTPNGQCYNPLFGFFQCPDNNMYYFAVSLVSPADFTNRVFLRVASPDGIQAVTTLKTYQAEDAGIQSGSSYHAVLLACQTGSQVSVVADSVDSGYVDMVPGTLSSFMAFKI